MQYDKNDNKDITHADVYNRISILGQDYFLSVLNLYNGSHFHSINIKQGKYLCFDSMNSKPLQWLDPSTNISNLDGNNKRLLFYTKIKA